MKLRKILAGVLTQIHQASFSLTSDLYKLTPFVSYPAFDTTFGNMTFIENQSVAYEKYLHYFQFLILILHIAAVVFWFFFLLLISYGQIISYYLFSLLCKVCLTQIILT